MTDHSRELAHTIPTRDCTPDGAFGKGISGGMNFDWSKQDVWLNLQY